MWCSSYTSRTRLKIPYLTPHFTKTTSHFTLISPIAFPLFYLLSPIIPYTLLYPLFLSLYTPIHLTQKYPLIFLHFWLIFSFHLCYYMSIIKSTQQRNGGTICIVTMESTRRQVNLTKT